MPLFYILRFYHNNTTTTNTNNNNDNKNNNEINISNNGTHLYRAVSKFKGALQ